MSEPDETAMERLYRAGVAALSDSELISLLTGSLATARDVVRDGLPSLARTDWTTRRGIPKRSAARLSASIELGRRLAAAPPDNRAPITTADAVAPKLIARYGSLPQEHLGALYLDARHRIVAERVIFIGTINSALVSTREVLKTALDLTATALLLFHNHPSGDPSPSAEDLLFTRKLVDAARLFSVDVLDHLILGNTRYVSLTQRGVM